LRLHAAAQIHRDPDRKLERRPTSETQVVEPDADVLRLAVAAEAPDLVAGVVVVRPQMTLREFVSREFDEQGKVRGPVPTRSVSGHDDLLTLAPPGD
jgi:hypothetical protein